MKKLQTKLFVFLIAALLFQACALVPLTGRRQLSLVSDTEMLSMSYAQYDEFQKENRMSSNWAATNEVKHVGRNIQNAVTAYFAQNNMSQGLNGYAWEFNLVESKEANAWCMPGGKVMVYSGILPLAQNETDRLGLIFMAMAGYDPRSAIGFWQRMAQKAGAQPPEFLSTHPTDKKRISKIIAAMPEALKYYKK